MNRVYQIYFEQSIFVLLLFLSRRTFDTGWSDSMEMDETPQRRSGLHRKHSPHHERLFLFVRRVDRRSCPHQTSEINVEHYYLKTDGPSGLLQDFIVWCKCVKSTDESRRQRRWKYKSSKDNQKRLPKISWYKKEK